MAPLVIEGDTLGQKYRNYNKLVNEAMKNDSTNPIAAINHEEPDLDNLFKIDVACNKRNVEYILEILKCDDMLYVSRAIKKSTWLITDQQYAHIINPTYLHSDLYPQMTSKAFNKLILHIRLNLVDEKRVEEFFNYYNQNDFDKAINWLPRCSSPLIEEIIRKNTFEIPIQLLKRLYEKSFTFLEILLENYTDLYSKHLLIAPAMFLLHKDHEKFLDIIESIKIVHKPRFGPKYTKIAMEKSPERIKNNLEKYVDVLNCSVFAKYLKPEEVKDFILKHITNKKVRSWFTYKKIKYFLNRLPFQERFDFVQKYFIERSCEAENLENETWDDIVEYCNLPLEGILASHKNIYSWYVYAPFSTAFEDLKLMIRKESNPTERIWILRSILKCAGRDQYKILRLLKYYHQNHINEPFMFKIQFVNHLITKTDTHKYGAEAWGYLNELFNSLEMFNRPKESLQVCVKSILLYKVIHGEEIPETIESKFDFHYYISYEYADHKKKFNAEEREKIFNYFYKYHISKFTAAVTTEKESDETVDVILSIFKILDVWNKELENYPFVLQKIRDLASLKKECSWKIDLSSIYNFKKSWRKLLFPESIILSTTQDSCINALKHDPELLQIYRKEVNSCINDNLLFFGRFLRKIQIYFDRSLSDSFKATFIENLNQINLHKPSIQGLCILFTQKELLDFVQKYAPTETKIVWSQPDDIKLSIRKNIASCMHLSRPHPPLEMALLYAKGDYLKYVLPSINAIFYNISSTQICEHVAKLVKTPVSLQKHGIRVAFAKQNHKELETMFTEIWKSTKNRSIRKDIFCETYKMLCRESDETVILEIWAMLSMFIGELTFEENKKIYLTLSKAENVPLSIRPAFWMKSYEFLQKMPVHANCKNLINDLNTKIIDIMEFMDVDFMAKKFLENFDKNFTTQEYSYSRQVATYMLSTKSESVQTERYEKVFEPLVDKAVAAWNEQFENVHYARNNLHNIFTNMSRLFQNLVVNKEMMFPIAFYTTVLNKLLNALSINENYILLTFVKLSLGYTQTVYDLKTKRTDFNSDTFKKLLTNEIAPIFGILCLNYLKKDVAKHFSSIYIIFAKVLSLIFEEYARNDDVFKMGVLKALLSDKNFVNGYLVAIELMPSSSFLEDHEIALKLELMNEISTHNSKEVAAHYWRVTNN